MPLLTLPYTLTKHSTSVLNDIPIEDPLVVPLPHTWYLDSGYRIDTEQTTSIDTETYGIGQNRQTSCIVYVTTFIIINLGSLIDENLYTISLHHTYAPELTEGPSKTSVDKDVAHFIVTIQYLLSLPLEALAPYLNEPDEDLLGLVYWRYGEGV